MTHPTPTPATSTRPTAAPRPRLVIPIGDPGGIGPEVVLRALADPTLHQIGALTVMGDRALLTRTYDHLRQLDPHAALADPDTLPLVDMTMSRQDRAAIALGQESAAGGAASFHWLDSAIAQTLAGEFDGIVTGPISKAAWKAAGFDYPGQTELLAEKAHVDRFGMLFVARSPHTNWLLCTLLATTHIPLRAVPAALSPALLTQKLDLLLTCLHRDFGLAAPRIAIAGLNPHSGENGKLGTEEQEWLVPWLQAIGDRYPQANIMGPVPPDTLWVKPGQAWFTDATVAPADAYLALYHDQGLIPVKLMAFDRAVNTTIGLPFVRTSPDHGTAFDIAPLGVANPTSMKAAIHLGAEFCRTRQQSGGYSPVTHDNNSRT